MTDSVTPNDMPGADADTITETVTQEVQPPEPQAGQGLSADKLAELNRTLREERNQWKREAREAKDQTDTLLKQFAELKTQLGVDKESEFDPKGAIESLRSELESERKARLRADVARTKNVDPKFIHGSTLEDMEASADEYLADVQQRIEDALKQAKSPVSPPASSVTGNDKIVGPQQITSRDELQKMSVQERMAAYKEGRLDSLLGK